MNLIPGIENWLLVPYGLCALLVLYMGFEFLKFMVFLLTFKSKGKKR